MKLFSKTLGIFGLLLWITCLIVLIQKFGIIACLLGLGCEYGGRFMTISRLLD